MDIRDIRIYFYTYSIHFHSKRWKLEGNQKNRYPRYLNLFPYLAVATAPATRCPSPTSALHGLGTRAKGSCRSRSLRAGSVPPQLLAATRRLCSRKSSPKPSCIRQTLNLSFKKYFILIIEILYSISSFSILFHTLLYTNYQQHNLLIRLFFSLTPTSFICCTPYHIILSLPSLHPSL